MKHKELTEDELEMIHWRATRGCHFEGAFLYASEYGKQVIQEDVPFLITEIRRLRAAEQCVHPTPPTARSISVTCPKCGTFIGVDFANTAGG